MNFKLMFFTVSGWVFGLLFSAIGLINTFWGNDTKVGVVILLLSSIFYPPVSPLIKRWTGYTIPMVIKLILGVLILLGSLGVGELFDKIELMRQSF